MTHKKLIPSVFAAAAVTLAMALFLISPARYSQSVREGVSLWAVSVLPATFPFLFLTALFTRFRLYGKLSRALSPLTGRLFAVSGAGGGAALLAMLSGYPVGARSVSDLAERGAIPAEETFRLACLATTSGPMFLVGGVGTAMFQSPLCGWILLGSHLIAVSIVCLILRFGKKAAPSRPAVTLRHENVLYDSLYSSVISILCVGGSIAVFYAFGQMLADLTAFLPLGDTGIALLRGLLEMTAGCALLSQDPCALSLALCAFLVTFGGICVLVQQLAFLGKAGVKPLPFLGVKFLQGVLAAAICYPLALLLP
ncbi:MAG: hypothetical protein K2H43_03335 [Clostridia bacterium]|nr:hypothetical protein [Clostridia bacterium]